MTKKGHSSNFKFFSIQITKLFEQKRVALVPLGLAYGCSLSLYLEVLFHGVCIC